MTIFCIFLSLILGLISYLIDFILRKKEWKDNSKSEKMGIVLTFLVIFPYVLNSLLGMFLGFGTYGMGQMKEIISKTIINFGLTIPTITIICLILSLVLRKIEKAKISNLLLIIGLIYSISIIGIAFILS